MSNRRSGGGLGGHPGVEDHLQQDVAELLAHRRRVVVDDRVVGLVRLLEQVAAQRGVRLLGVPGAAARRAQPVHDRDDVEQPGPGGLRRPGHDLDAGIGASCGAARTTTSSPSAAAAAASGTSVTVRPSARSASAVAAAPGRAASGRCPGDRAPAGGAEQAGQPGADGDDERDGHPASLRDAARRRPTRPVRLPRRRPSSSSPRMSTTPPSPGTSRRRPRARRSAGSPSTPRSLADLVDQRGAGLRRRPRRPPAPAAGAPPRTAGRPCPRRR